jgi:V/A-type H+/Na+-transporting ATPase subunit E
MSLEAITDKIRTDAAREARDLLEAAERERDEALRSARAAMEEEFSRDLGKLSRDMAELRARLEFHQRRSEERELENRRRSVIDAAIGRAVASLCAIPDGEYLELIGRLLDGCTFRGDVEVLISPADERRVTASFLEGRSGRGCRFVLSGERHTGTGGVLLRSGRVSLNATFSTAAALAHEELAMDLAGLLSGKR